MILVLGCGIFPFTHDSCDTSRLSWQKEAKGLPNMSINLVYLLLSKSKEKVTRYKNKPLPRINKCE